MTQTGSGIAAVIAACVIWGLSPLYYRALDAVPPLEILAHRTFWSLVFFATLLGVQGRLGRLRAALSDRRSALIILAAALIISINWFLFIWAIHNARATEASLGYYIFPLVAVALGRIAFGERLDRLQIAAVALAVVAVSVLAVRQGALPWVSLVLATSFGIYGLLKKRLSVGAVTSVTGEVLLILPISAGYLLWLGLTGQGAFGADLGLALLLIGSGPVTALPLILFSHASQRVAYGTIGLLQYVNPTLQFLIATVIFREPFGTAQALAFGLIWAALALYSAALLRQERASKAASISVQNVT
ncbi:EamA family transporter RarD [Litorisediminicola beolgyonensis]|uniref:EamA family transporter RarD n=1 Tax=Litorisediminicola beolgyonensis TaxID=1173614 RepID=A0ABW3ZJ07_9RHOB